MTRGHVEETLDLYHEIADLIRPLVRTSGGRSVAALAVEVAESIEWPVVEAVLGAVGLCDDMTVSFRVIGTDHYVDPDLCGAIVGGGTVETPVGPASKKNVALWAVPCDPDRNSRTTGAG